MKTRGVLGWEFVIVSIFLLGLGIAAGIGLSRIVSHLNIWMTVGLAVLMGIIIAIIAVILFSALTPNRHE